jgi:N4-(beta-N-acetylglucosaminyl)-L-asparaginase
MTLSRRELLLGAAVGSLGMHHVNANETSRIELKQRGRAASKPVLIAAGNALAYLTTGYEILKKGGDTLDAAIAVIKGPEDDPNEDSVGLGGLPNEEGVVELDASCMHGPTRQAGAVGGVRNIKNVSMLAREVMLHSGHVMLVGDGAERFAVARGFSRENLLTDASRKVWLLWKESHSDWWGPGLSAPQWRERMRQRLHSDADRSNYLERLASTAVELGIDSDRRDKAIRDVLFPPTGTTHCSALGADGTMSGCTTTSGLAWKIPGRLGDSPIIGAGCYTDQDVGSAGATGSGEENIKNAGAYTIVENLRKGMSPLEAGMDALQRIVHRYAGDRERLQFMDMTYYILRKDGAYAGVSMWTGYEPNQPHTIAIHDGEPRLEKTVSVFEGASRAWPPLVAPSPTNL